MSGLCLAVAAYFACFFKGFADRTTVLTLSIFILWGAVVVPMFLRDYYSLQDRTIFWNGVPGIMPKWSVTTLRLLVIILIAHLVWSLARCRDGLPGIIDGQFVLESNGRIFRVITSAEYFSLHDALLRESALSLVYFYFVPAICWWSQRNQKHGSILKDGNTIQ